MQKIKSTLKQLWADESGQGATEYILLLVIVVAVAMLFKNSITETISAKVKELGDSIAGFTGGQ
jgi:Flp pilus assembly pilin Flp